MGLFQGKRMRLASWIRLRRESNRHWSRQWTVSQSVDDPGIGGAFVGRCAELLFQRHDLARINGDRTADRCKRALCDHRERKRAAFFHAGQNRMPVFAVCHPPLYLLREILDIGNHVDAVTVVRRQRFHVGGEIDADDGSTTLDEILRLRFLGSTPAFRIGNQEHHAGQILSLRKIDMRRGNEPGMIVLIGHRIFGLCLRRCQGGRLGGSWCLGIRQGRKRHAQHRCQAKRKQCCKTHSHLPTTPLNPPPIKSVASIMATAGPMPETAR
ncbi:hypothetical protein D3C73_767420 [compost metagenome]